jgi:hypothetical protein
MPKIIAGLRERLLYEAERQLMENGYSAMTIRGVAKILEEIMSVSSGSKVKEASTNNTEESVSRDASASVFTPVIRPDNRLNAVIVRDVVTRFPKPGMAATNNWFNHLLFSPDGRNFAFIHRWRVYFPEHKTWRFYVTRMFSSDLEGNLNELPMNGHASHFTWKSERELIIFSEYPAGLRQYNIYTIPENKVEVIAENLLPNDGHCSFSPDGSWLLTDSYIREDATRCIALYHPATGNAYEVGSFFSDASWLPYARCDLHPRWSPDMTAICFDSMHEGFRGTYALDTTSLVK